MAKIGGAPTFPELSSSGALVSMGGGCRPDELVPARHYKQLAFVPEAHALCVPLHEPAQAIKLSCIHGLSYSCMALLKKSVAYLPPLPGDTYSPKPFGDRTVKGRLWKTGGCSSSAVPPTTATADKGKWSSVPSDTTGASSSASALSTPASGKKNMCNMYWDFHTAYDS